MIDDIGLAAGLDVTFAADVAVVGAGPAGIVVSLELAAAGRTVILVESGSRSYEPDLEELSRAATWDVDRHAPVPLASRRQIGGSTVIWGGRCVPYDPIDFEHRPYADGHNWPLAYSDISPYFERACHWCVCGRPVFSAQHLSGPAKQIVPGMRDANVRATDLERWSLPTNFGSHYLKRIREAHNLRLLTHLTCTSVEWSAATSTVSSISCRSLNGSRVTIRARHYVLAAGGLETTRLLLNTTGPGGHPLGNASGHLGRYYMAHVEGVVAEVQFATDPTSTIYGYERDVDGTYIRRRFTFSRDFQLARRLPNIAFWLANPELPDASHNSSILSFVYLMLTSPLGRLFAPEAQRLPLTGSHVPGTPYGVATISPMSAHFTNVARSPLDALHFAASFGYGRFLAQGRRLPGFFVPSPHNRYPLQYHGEHLPHRDSRVSLSTERDSLGVPRLDIDLRFGDDDIEGTGRAHKELDTYLRQLSIGKLVYRERDFKQAIARRLGGGFHQIGTTRMSASSSNGVVDPNLAVHGVPNLHVASSSVFVTSSQANSTFMIVALAVRLADRLKKLLA